MKKVDTFGHSDPYCIVYCNGEKIGKTGIKKNTSKPQWNEVFNISEPSFDLKFDVFDWDRVGSHDFHGKVSINRADLPMCRTTQCGIRAGGRPVQETEEKQKYWWNTICFIQRHER